LNAADDAPGNYLMWYVEARICQPVPTRTRL